MSIELSIHFIQGFIAGFVFGLVMSLFFSKKIQIDKAVGLVVIAVWLVFHIYGFYVDREIPFIFDVIGGCSAGHLIGFDVAETVRKFKKIKK